MPHIKTMLKITPILLALLYGLIYYRFSIWKTRAELNSKSSELADPTLRAMCENMANVLDLEQVKVHIYEIDPVNGLAAPDGRIFITRGFFKKYVANEVSAEEMASVIAHELGHVALGHSRRRMIDFSGQNAIRAALGMVLGRIVPVVGVWLAGFLTSMLAARLSRQDEYEADAYAAALLIKTGIGVEAQKTLLAKLEALVGASGQPLAWLMSHPKAVDRIAAIEELEARWL
jgi:putative metalloprotease